MPTTDTITITLPLPPKELDPNGRHHWRAKLSPKRKYRQTAYLCGLEVRPQRPIGEAMVRIVYYHRTANYKDRDNILASLKAGIDGLVDAQVLASDSDVTYPPVQRHKDAGNPRVELTIEPLEAR